MPPAKTTAKAKPAKAPAKTKIKKLAAKPKPVTHNKEEVFVATAPKVEDVQNTAPVGDKEKYFEAVGRRKSAIARVRLYTKKSSDQEPPEGKALILIDGKPYFEYFNEPEMQNTVDSPLKKLKSIARFKATVLVSGGGMNGQAGAIRHGLSRALVLFDENFSKKFRKAGYLTRDSREKERRKYGLKKARKAPRWAKR